MLNKLQVMFTNNIELVVLSFLVALLGASTRKTAKTARIYFLTALVTGFVFGFAVSNTPAIASWAFIAALLGALTGPTTLIKLQGKTLFDVIESLKHAADDVKDIKK